MRSMVCDAKIELCKCRTPIELTLTHEMRLILQLLTPYNLKPNNQVENYPSSYPILWWTLTDSQYTDILNHGKTKR